MDCYLLVFDTEKLDTSLVTDAFENSYQFSARCWFVAPPEPTTCSDIIDELGLAESALGTHCVVVKLTDYNGWAEQALWEKLSLWESL